MTSRRSVLLIAAALCSCTSRGDGEYYGPAIELAAYEADVRRPCERPDKIRGVTLGIIEDNRLPVYGYGSPQCMWAIEEIAGLGADWVAVTPYITMIDCSDARIIPYFELPRSRMEEMLAGAIRQSKSMGLKVFLVPHIYTWTWCWRGHLRPGGGTRGTKEGWDTWFDSYRGYMMELAALAAREEVDMLSIGVELQSATHRFGHRFATLAGEVRSAYPGKLTYCANWNEVQDVPFWGSLDYIGVNAFYPMSETGSDDPEEILRIAGTIAESLETLSDTHRRPVIFTEVGFKALEGALKEPWIWPEHVKDPVVDDEIQALLYDITFYTLWGQDWFHGLFVWRYMSDPSDYSQEAPYGYPPRLKPAEKVIDAWFHCGR